MSGDVSDRKRLISVTGGNLRQNHLYISGHHDFFPSAAYGASTSKGGKGREITLAVDGLNEPIRTDIATNGSNGTPRNFFRARTWLRRFFEKHQIREGKTNAMTHWVKCGI